MPASLVERILSNVDDHDRLDEYLGTDTPMGRLIDCYHDFTGDNEALLPLSGAPTGRELKEGILSMPAEAQVELLYLFTKGRSKEAEEAEEKETLEERRDERKLKQWLIRGFFYVFATVVLLIVGGVMTLTLLQHHTTNADALTGILDKALEILKLLLETASPSE